MSKQGLVELWRKRLDDCAKSGRSVVDWCGYNHVTVPQYYYWKRRLAVAQPQAPQQPEFLPVQVVETTPLPAATTGVTVHLAGAKIELATGFDPATLRAVVVALSAISC
jgi:hypothetical protein